MSKTRIVPFASEHLPAVRHFARKLWPWWPEDHDFYRWRFLDAADFHRAFLALKDDECLSLICGFKRELLVEGERRSVLDCFDWATLPEHQNAGWGLFVLNAMLKKHPYSVLGFSGTDQSVALRERMGWKPLPPVRNFVLPLKPGADTNWAKMLAMKAGGSVWFRPRRRQEPEGGRVIVTTGIDRQIETLYQGTTGYGTVLLPDFRYLRWLLHGYAGAGHFLPLYFFVGGKLRGWALARIYYPEGGAPEAALIECFAPQPGRAQLYTWMISETLVRLAPFGVHKIRAASSCPALVTAIERNRFLEREPIHIDYRPRKDSLPTEPIYLAWNGSDFAFRPLPVWSWAVPLAS